MDTIVGKRKADEQRLHAEQPLEIADDRDRAAARQHHRLFRPFVGKRVLRLIEEGRLVGKLDRRRTAVRLELGRAVCRQALAHEGSEGLAYLVRVLLVDQPERHLRRSLCGYHGLEALAGVAASDAVELGGRARPDELEYGAALLARGHRKPDLAEEALGGLN